MVDALSGFYCIIQKLCKFFSALGEKFTQFSNLKRLNIDYFVIFNYFNYFQNQLFQHFQKRNNMKNLKKQQQKSYRHFIFECIQHNAWLIIKP